MIFIRLFFIGTLITVVLATTTWARAWRGIVPLRSTRADVERLLGPPETGSRNIYNSANEKVVVTYSGAPCAYGWRVPAGTVVSVLVYPKNPPSFADFKLDPAKYTERRDVDNEFLYYYVSGAEGMNYSVNKGLVTSFEYYPSARDKHLLCPIPKASSRATGNASRIDALLGNPSGEGKPSAVEGAYMCSVHRDEVSSRRGYCPRCGRRLVARKARKKTSSHRNVGAQQVATLHTKEKSIVTSTASAERK